MHKAQFLYLFLIACPTIFSSSLQETIQTLEQKQKCEQCQKCFARAKIGLGITLALAAATCCLAWGDVFRGTDYLELKPALGNQTVSDFILKSTFALNIASFLYSCKNGYQGYMTSPTI